VKAYFVDTNYILRLLLKDNETQHDEAKALFNKAIREEVVLQTSVLVFFELNWVLSSFYEYNKDMVISTLKKLLQMNVLEFEEKNMFLTALNVYTKHNINLIDCYYIVYFRASKFDEFASFDKRLLQTLKNQ